MPAMDPQSHYIRVLVDANHYGQFRLPIWGTEGIAVRSINSKTTPPLVEISLAQITLYGELPRIRERLATMVALLDGVVAEPERWDDITMTKVGPGRWRRLRPHPFHNDPTAPGADPATPRSESTRRRQHSARPRLARIIPLRRRDD
jgi:hypothetical protein